MPTRWFAKRRLTRIGRLPNLYDLRRSAFAYVRPVHDRRQPLPPDDPTAHQFMHCVDNKRGAGRSGTTTATGRTSKTTPWPEYINIDDPRRLKAQRR